MFSVLRRESIAPLLVQSACQPDLELTTLAKIIRCIRYVRQLALFYNLFRHESGTERF